MNIPMTNQKQMTLLETIKQDWLEARKSKETIKSNLLGTLVSEATKNTKQPSDDEVVSTVKKFIKNIETTLDNVQHNLMQTDACKFLVEALTNKDANATVINQIHQNATLSTEKEILNSYLPKQLSKEELIEIIQNQNCLDVGKVMKYLKENYANQFDSKMASEIIKSNQINHTL